MKKKGIFFTFIAITLTAVVILSFIIHTQYRLRNKMFVIETRIDTLNDFIQDTETDLERGLYIAAFRAILSLEQYITTEGVFLNNTELNFKEIILYGTINNTAIDIMQGATFPDWAERIQEEADKIDITINFLINDITLNQTNPWYVDVNSNISMNVTDKKQTASWEKNRKITTSINIENFEDPLYVINSYGRVTNKIKRTNATDFGDVNQLKTHLENSYYIASTSGPSFLMRLEGKLSSSPYGIESLVNVREFTAEEVPVVADSHVDYIYFDEGTVENCLVNETALDPYYYWFRLDNQHLGTYEATCFSQ
ncbi:hypothetical protein J4209_00245 [Candidatus Woesearchaeota archaeon]|nr:hypothetical protein [Candidatus Woesearchaeota archaeon]